MTMRTHTWQDPLEALGAVRTMSGLEAITGMVEGRLPPPPIATLLGMELIEASFGRAVFALEPAEWMYNPIGSVHGGIAATLLDSALGCAVHTTLDAGVGYTTGDLHVRYVRGMTSETGRVVCEAQVVHSGRSTATAEGRLLAEADGRLLAHGTTGCLILRP